MLAEELRKKSLGDLQKMILGHKKELMNLRFQKGAGQLENHAQVRVLRREIARIKTVMHAMRNPAPVKE